MRGVILFVWILLGYSAYSQTGDSTMRISAPKNSSEKIATHKHSPSTAALLSAVLPGAGQVYNKKSWWWKVPIIYGVGGALVYGYTFYNQGYYDFKGAYKYRITTGSEINGIERYDRYQTPTLKSIRDSYRQARDQCAFGIVLLYALQILDASVEAHLLEFNINDDLSLKVQPVYVPYGSYAYSGLQFNLRLK